MKLIKKGEGVFLHGKKEYGLKHIIDFYKQGKQLAIRDEFDNDITKESLAVAIFGYRTTTSQIAEFIDAEHLDDIIHAGGYENWNNRRRRE